MNWIGLVAALTAFFCIWVGHVAVRKIEFVSPTIWFPTFIFISLGLFTEYLSLITAQLPLQTALGIAGITLLWDALEFIRQQNRIKKGHAPANPNNPRHAKILAEHSSATTIDLLKREPTGSPLLLGERLGVREKP
ncbi:MAG: DUF4491 family protein [Anaerolineales bacterium]|nr:DUF4491 family protein [Anaerolineales bacterium]MDP2776526.1 DUF4491 family protein [Anaerolineales bacterium]